MGKRLNALLGKKSKASKLRMVANVAVSRIAVLTKLHGVRCSQARSDVIQLLRQAHHQRALLRVEQVIEEQNALDALLMIETYCHLLGERTEMITNSWECPDELREIISSLIFASSRCGAFPELQEIRRMLTSRYGKEFAYNAVELTNNCRVYPKMVQRLSIERASSEAKQILLKQIAKDNGIALQLDHDEALDIASKEAVSSVSETQMSYLPSDSEEDDSLILGLKLVTVNSDEEATENARYDDEMSEDKFLDGCRSKRMNVRVNESGDETRGNTNHLIFADMPWTLDAK